MGEAGGCFGFDTESRVSLCGHLLKGVKIVFRWNARGMRAAVAVSAFLALVIGSGADWRWS